MILSKNDFYVLDKMYDGKMLGRTKLGSTCLFDLQTGKPLSAVYTHVNALVKGGTINNLLMKNLITKTASSDNISYFVSEEGKFLLTKFIPFIEGDEVHFKRA